MLVWKSDIDIGCLPLFFSALFFEIESLTGQGAHQLARPLHSTSTRIIGMRHHNWLALFNWLFYAGVGDLNSAPHVCIQALFPPSSPPGPTPNPHPHTTPIKSVSRLSMMVHICKSGPLRVEATASSRLGLDMYWSFVSRNTIKLASAPCWKPGENMKGYP